MKKFSMIDPDTVISFDEVKKRIEETLETVNGKLVPKEGTPKFVDYISVINSNVVELKDHKPSPNQQIILDFIKSRNNYRFELSYFPDGTIRELSIVDKK